MLVLSTRSEVDNITKEKVMKEKEVQESVAVFNGIEMRISSLDDIWLTQKQIAKMFETSIPNVSMHIKAFLKELDDEQVSSVVKKSLTTEKNGRHEGFTQTNEVMLYSFDVICQIGYRVNCKRGVQFRQFATQAIREKLNRDLLNRDEVENALRIENGQLKSRLGEAVMEISELRQEIEYDRQFVPDHKDYGKPAKNGYPRTTFQRGGFKSRGGRKVELKPQYVTIDLLAVAKYLLP